MPVLKLQEQSSVVIRIQEAMGDIIMWKSKNTGGSHLEKSFQVDLSQNITLDKKNYFNARRCSW